MKKMMSLPRLVGPLPFLLGLVLSARADQSFAGNVTITGGEPTGNLIVTGNIDSDGNTFTFGPGTNPAVALTYADDAMPGGTYDTLRFSLNRVSASWLWMHATDTTNPTGKAMRLDIAHQLILYRSDGTTAGVTLLPASNAIKLGTNASSTLTADNTSGAITAGGGFEVAGNFTSANSSSTTSFMGNVGIGTSPEAGARLHVAGPVKFKATTGYYGTRIGSNAGGDSYVWIGSRVGVPAIQGQNEAFSSVLPLALQAEGGNVGIGTSAPLTKLHVNDGTNRNFLVMSDAVQWGTAGIAIGSFTDGAGAFAPLSLLGSTVSINGNVGIGTTSPDQYSQLHVAGTGSSARFTLGNGTSGYSTIALRNGATKRAWLVGSQFNVDQAFEITPSSADGGVTFSTPALLIAASGKVGIGSVAPSAKLQVSDLSAGSSNQELFSMQVGYSPNSSQKALTWRDGTTVTGQIDTRYNGTSVDMVFGHLYNSGHQTSDVFTIKGTGKIGVGTTDPYANLTVSRPATDSISFEDESSTAGFIVGGSDARVRLQLGVGGSTIGPFGGWIQASYDNSLAGSGNSGAEPLLLNPLGGDVGIGTKTPASKLTVAGAHADTQVRLFSDLYGQGTSGANTALLTLWASEPTLTWTGAGIGNNITNATGMNRITTTRGASYIRLLDNQIAFNTVDASGNDLLAVQMVAGNVGIGTANPGAYKLAVNGTIHAKEVVVDNLGWADYVFADDYRLASLAEIESHIKARKHLPGIPSAAEVAERGVSMGDMQSKLLSKVEELTLHLIRMEKENAALRERVQKLEATAANP